VTDRGRRRALLDYRLADQDNGILLAERIKQLCGDEVAIFLMTAETDEQILAEANAKSLRVLRKPLKPINLRPALMLSKRWHIFLAAGEHWVGVDSNRFHLNQRPTAKGRAAQL
jgi:CheY-like chemotaxis protein